MRRNKERERERRLSRWLDIGLKFEIEGKTTSSGDGSERQRKGEKAVAKDFSALVPPRNKKIEKNKRIPFHLQFLLKQWKK